MPQPVKNKPPVAPIKMPPAAPVAKPMPALINGFFGDEKSASKDFVYDGKALKITVYFPANCSKEEQTKRLIQFSDKNLNVIGQQAIVLGLGHNSEKHHAKIDAITFKHDDKGQLVDAEKFYANGFKKKISDQFFQIKITDPAKQAKVAKYIKQLEAFEHMRQKWSEILNLAPPVLNRNINAGGREVVEEAKAKKDKPKLPKKLPVAAKPNFLTEPTRVPAAGGTTPPPVQVPTGQNVPVGGIDFSNIPLVEVPAGQNTKVRA